MWYEYVFVVRSTSSHDSHGFAVMLQKVHKLQSYKPVENRALPLAKANASGSEAGVPL